MNIEFRKSQEKLLEELKGFVASKVHLFYKLDTQRNVDALTVQILESPISDKVSEIGLAQGISMTELIELRAQRNMLFGALTFFEDAVANLENQIQKMLDSENETQPNENNDN